MALARIKSQIIKAKIPPASPSGSAFVPEGALSAILNIQNVTEALADPRFNIPSHKLDDAANTVIEQGLNVFSILLELNCERYLSVFIENDCLDSSLALTESLLAEVIPEGAIHFYNLQFQYRPYFLRKSQYHRNLGNLQALPYVDERKIGGGGFSSVYAVSIHHAHQNLVQQSKDSKVRTMV
jgi:hypothetical protein